MTLITKEFIEEMKTKTFLENRTICAIGFLGSMVTNIRVEKAVNDYDLVVLYIPEFKELVSTEPTKYSQHVSYISEELGEEIDCQVIDARRFFELSKFNNLESLNALYGFEKLKSSEYCSFNLYEYLGFPEFEQMLEALLQVSEKVILTSPERMIPYVIGTYQQREFKFSRATEAKERAKEYANFVRFKSIFQEFKTFVETGELSISHLMQVSEESQPYILRNSPELFESELTSELEAYKEEFTESIAQAKRESIALSKGISELCESKGYKKEMEELFGGFAQKIEEVIFQEIVKSK